MTNNTMKQTECVIKVARIVANRCTATTAKGSQCVKKRKFHTLCTLHGNKVDSAGSVTGRVGSKSFKVAPDVAYHEDTTAEPILTRYFARVNDTSENIYADDDLYEAVQRGDVVYEGIYGKCRAYLDCERDYGTELERSDAFWSDFEEFTEAIVNKFPDVPIYAASASGATKDKFRNSFHFIIHQEYECGRDVADYIKDLECDGIDHGVYSNGRQLFRVIGASKEGEQRPFLVYDNNEFRPPVAADYANFRVSLETYKPYDYSAFLTPDDVTELEEPEPSPSLITYAYKRFLDYERRLTSSNESAFEPNPPSSNGYQKLTRLRPSFCEWCNRKHNRESYFIFSPAEDPYNLDSEAPVFVRCPRYNDEISDGMKIIYTPEKAPRLNEALINQYKNTNYADDIKEQFKEIGEVVEFDEKFCADFAPLMDELRNPTCDVIVMRADMGRGKTTAIEHIVRDNPDVSCGFVSNRKSLSYQYGRQFRKYGFAVYNDEEHKRRLIREKRWICQHDSISRVRLGGNLCKTDRAPGSPLIDIFIQDEAEQGYAQLSTRTYLGQSNRDANFNTFMNLTRHCGQLVLMDANITPETVKEFVAMRGKECKIKTFWNVYRGDQFNYQIYEEDTEIIANTISDIKDGKRVYIACNRSVKKIDDLRELIQQQSPEDTKILVVSTDTYADAETQEFIRDPNTDKYNCVIVSPSIQSGVSIDKRGLYDSIRGVFTNLTNRPHDALQMLRRVRYPSSNVIEVAFMCGSVSGARKPAEILQQVERGLTQGGWHLSPIERLAMEDFEYDPTTTGYKHGTLMRIYCNNNARRNREASEFMRYFTEAVTAYNHDISFQKTSKEEYKLKPGTVSLTERNAIAVIKAEDITKEVKRDLDRRIKDGDYVNREEKAEQSKYELNQLYGINMSDLETPDVVELSDRANIARYHALKDVATSDNVNEALLKSYTRLGEIRERALIKCDYKKITLCGVEQWTAWDRYQCNADESAGAILNARASVHQRRSLCIYFLKRLFNIDSNAGDLKRLIMGESPNTIMNPDHIKKTLDAMREDTFKGESMVKIAELLKIRKSRNKGVATNKRALEIINALAESTYGIRITRQNTGARSKQGYYVSAKTPLAFKKLNVVYDIPNDERNKEH